MNILHITTSFKRKKGDIITPWLVNLMIQQTQKHNVLVLTSGYLNTKKKQIYKKIKIHRFNYAPKKMMIMTHDMTIMDFLSRNPIYILLLPVFIISGIGETAKIIKNNKIDIVNIHWPFPLALLYAPIKLFIRRPNVNVYYGAELKLFENRFKYMKDIIYRMFLKSDYSVFISNSTKKQAMHLFLIEKSKIIPYGIKMPAKHNLKKEKFLLFTGRLVERKGVEYLVDAMKNVKEDYNLIIVGDGVLFNEINEQIRKNGLKDRIEMKGFIKEKELIELYKKASLFILPAVYDSRGDTEGLGMVLVEAMSFLTPVLATGIGGINDIVINDKTGINIKEKDSMDIADRINEILDDKVKYAKLQENGYNYVLERFSLESISKEFDAVYEEIVGH